EVVLARGADPASDPVLVLRVAAAAAQSALPVSRHTLERLSADAAPLPEPWPRPARDALVALLGAGEPSVPVLEALDQAGVLVRLLPEWEAVRCKPQRNAVHRFTVDRHLVEAAVQASRLSRWVADAVGDRDTLELLHALTEADALATGPAAWSDWKAGLVDDLVGRTRAVLAGAPPPVAPPLDDGQLALAAAGELAVDVAGDRV